MGVDLGAFARSFTLEKPEPELESCSVATTFAAWTVRLIEQAKEDASEEGSNTNCVRKHY